jgi:hypothetical protein
MSLYDDASLVFLPAGGAGKDGKVFTLKPEEEVTGSEEVLNGDFSIDGDGTGGLLQNGTYGNWGWNISASAQGSGATSKIADGVLTLAAGSDVGDPYARAYATTGAGGNRDVLTKNTYYKLTYTVVSTTDDADDVLLAYVASSNMAAKASVGTHSLVLHQTTADTDKLFLFTVKKADVTISIDNVSIKELGQKPYDFDFSRGSNLTATRVNSAGVIEKGRENMILDSNNFDSDSDWSATRVALRTDDQAGYDSTNNATKLQSTAEDGTSRIYLDNSPDWDGVHTFSVFMKKGTAEGVLLQITDGGTVRASAKFDLTTTDMDDAKLVGSGSGFIGYDIVNAGGDWRRVSLTLEGLFDRINIYLADSTGETSTTNDVNLFVQDAQLEFGLVATPYMASTADVTGKADILENEPRFDYLHRVEGESSCGGLLMERASTNMFKQSEYFGNEWSTTNTAVDSKVTDVKSPEGVYNATLLKATQSGAPAEEHYIAESAISVTDGNMYALSFFARKKDYRYVSSRFTAANSAFTAASAWFDLENGVAATTDTDIMYSYMHDYGNGWYRCVAVAEATATTSSANFRIQLANGDGDALNFVATAGEGTYIYGAQIEELPYATSYIPTHGASADRAYDEAPRIDISEFNIKKHFSIYWEGFIDKREIPSDDEPAGYADQLTRVVSTFSDEGDGTGSNRILLYVSNIDGNQFSFIFQHRVDSQNIQKTAGFLNHGEKVKALIVINGSSMKAFVNGSEEGVALDIPDTKDLCHHLDLSDVYNDQGHTTEQLIIFPFALSDAEAESITT